MASQWVLTILGYCLNHGVSFFFHAMSLWMRGGKAKWGRWDGITRCLLLVFFLWLVGRHWHPYYGFTKLIEFDSTAPARLVPVLRTAPLYLHSEIGGYDGQFYAQLATSPALNEPGLSAAIDNLGYRARRMLLSWIAWVVGWGDPVAAVHAYAWLNPVLWLGLAAILWRLFPLGEWRATVAWAGLLFSSGTLHSVRFALCDLAALTLIAGAMWRLERGRVGQGMGWLSFAVLARETALLSVATLWPGAGARWRDWWRAGVKCLLVILPFAGWLVYLQVKVGRPEAGVGNFTWPMAGLFNKWSETLVGIQLEPENLLMVSCVLVQLGLTVQLLFLVIRPQWINRWWRLGAIYGVLLLGCGPAVWAGYPGAAPRVLLPLALAFNFLGVRARVGVLWLILGNLSVLNGVISLWDVTIDHPRELCARWAWHGSAVMETDQRWYFPEFRVGSRWAWCAQAGRLTLHVWPRQNHQRAQLSLKGISPRDLTIRQAGRVVWAGQLTTKSQWIQLPELPTEQGDLVLDISSDTPPQKEGPQAEARELGFACYGFKLD